MLTKKLKDFLEKEKIEYETIHHPSTYTAQETASTSHTSGNEFAKTVIINVDGRLIMTVLPASRSLDLEQLKKDLGTQSVSLASEREFQDHFRGCETGAMPPFGNLYGMEVIAAQKITEQREITFNGGTHQDLVRLKYEDYEKIVRPKVLKCSMNALNVPPRRGTFY